MEVSGTYTLDAPVPKVWALLMDPQVIAECLPGCDRLDPVAEDRYEATLTVGVAAITGSFLGTVAIADKQPPHSFRLLVEGSGRAGFAKGESLISLTELEDKTVVEVRGTAQVGGTIARVGQRLLGSVSQMLLDRFFTCLQQKATAARATD